MSADLTTADRAAVEKIVAHLEAGWNAMDGVAFAAPFAADADFVNIRAEHFRGRDTIAAGHAPSFDRSTQAARTATLWSPPVFSAPTSLLRTCTPCSTRRRDRSRGVTRRASRWCSRGNPLVGRLPRSTTQYWPRRARRADAM